MSLHQVINFDQLDEALPIHIHSKNVIIQPSSRTLENDSKVSNKITTQNMVDYSWEDRYTMGNLITYHQRTSLIAYVLSISNNYMIRIINEQNSARCLIKDFNGEITDISFSKSCAPYIASIDVNGSVKVNKVIINQEIIECQLILHIKAVPSMESNKTMKVSYSRVMWCWHHDSESRNAEESDSVGTNISLLLGIVHGSTCEIMQIDTIETELLSQADGRSHEPRIDRAGLKAISNSFQEQFYESESLSDLFLPYLNYTAPGEDSKITSLAISSDAAAFAVALRDGTVRFFTLDGSSQTGLKEAYSWKPFNGEAVWSLLFLDDCRPDSNIDSYWCHVIVGSAFNRELKLFRCDKWDCIQTVSFQSPGTPCLLLAHIDQSARYLIMSDIRRKALYVLELDSIDNNKTKLFKNVQEFVLANSLLSFEINTITNAKSPDGSDQISIKMFTITRESFQKMKVSYTARGHRLNEILVDMHDDCVDHDHESVNNVVDSHAPTGAVVSSSILTHVSSLQSANSSFQDPAIISTCNQLQHPNTSAMKSLPIDMSPTLKHLFSGAMEMTIPDREQEVNDSGEESEDEASIVDLMRESDTLQSSQHKSMNVEKNLYCKDGDDDEDEECGFPLPPCRPKNESAWNEDVIGNSHQQTAKISNCSQNEILLNEENSTLSRIENLIEQQQLQVEALTKAVQELQRAAIERENEVGKCVCKESRLQWTDQALREVRASCHETIVDQLDHRLLEAVEKAMPRLTVEINSRLDEIVRHKLTALESVTRDYLNDMLRDKKFITFLANNIGDIIDKPLRAAYLDMARKELVPSLGKSLDKLFVDAREVLKDGIKDVLGSVDESHKAAMRVVEEKLFLNMSTHQKSFSGEIDNKFKQLSMEMNVSRAILSDSLNKQKEQVSMINDALQSIKNAINENADHSSHDSRGHAMTNSNIHDREMKVNRMIASGDLAGALNEALSLTDMRILLSVCSRVNTKRVLTGNPSKPSQLQSSSILALIQQLSRDFNEEFDLKFEFLFDALLSLDSNESGIKGHVTKVLKGMSRRLQIHYNHEINPVLKDKLTVLMRLVTSRLDSSVGE